MTAEQPALPMFATVPEGADAEWLVRFLTGREWTTAREVLVLLGLPVTENGKRWLRKLADESKGRLGSGQRGYKLVREMTGEEYHHNRNWFMHQAEDMKRRVLEMDREFYQRQPVQL